MEQQEVFIHMALHAWNVNIGRADKFFNSLTDDELLKEIAPGKNRISYLLGHLVAVNDGMIALFGLGERAYSHLDEAFIKNPDRSALDIPEPSVLRSYWKKSNEELTAYFSRIAPAEWFARHSAMTDEDLEKEPWRNKLSVLINRTNHVAYHLGQMILAK